MWMLMDLNDFLLLCYPVGRLVHFKLIVREVINYYYDIFLECTLCIFSLLIYLLGIDLTRHKSLAL